MAEVLGIAASVAGLVSLTVTVSQLSLQYFSNIRKTSKTVQGYTRELSALHSVLLRIQEMVETPEYHQIFAKRPSAFPVPATAIRSCEAELADLKTRLEERGKRSRWSAKMAALVWPMEAKETRKSVDMFHRYLEIFNTALSLDVTLGYMATYEEVSRISKALQQGDCKEVLEWLSSSDPRADQINAISQRHTGTGQWLLENTKFQDWIHGAGSALWCYGNPGVGKTVMSSIVVEHLFELAKKQKCLIAWQYCKHHDQDNYAPEKVIRSFIRQMTEQRQSLPACVLKLFQSYRYAPNAPELSVLTSVLKMVSKETSSSEPDYQEFVILDALDECDNRAKIVELLLELGKMSIKVFVTSRPLPDIQDALGDTATLEISAEKSDLERYVKGKIEEHDDLQALVPTNLRENMVTCIANRANGMFLLVRLLMDNIFALLTLKEIQQALKTGPPSLDDMYQDTITRILQQSPSRVWLATRVLSWTLHARHSLTVDELRHALGVEAGTATLDDENLCTEKIMISVCEGLVVVDPQHRTIRLVHVTATEFLHNRGLMDSNHTHVDIGRTCLTYLRFDYFKLCPCKSSAALQERLLHFPFLWYAAHNWGYHARYGLDEELEREVELYLQDPSIMSSSTQILHIRRSKDGCISEQDFQTTPKGLSALHIAAFWGLTSMVDLLIKNSFQPDDRDTQGWSALHWAASNGHEGTVRALLQKKANVSIRDNHQWTPLFWTVFSGHRDILALLLDHGGDISATDSRSWTLLHWAVYVGDEAIVKLLLERGIDIEVPDDNGLNVLDHVAQNSPTCAAKLLDEHRVRLCDSAAGRGDTALLAVLLQGASNEATLNIKSTFMAPSHRTFTRKKHRSDDIWYFSRKNHDGNYLDQVEGVPFANRLLIEATQDENEIVVRFLVENGINLAVRNGGGHMPLHFASACQNSKIPKLLLENGADPTAITWRNRTTPLDIAKRHGSTEVVKLLEEASRRWGAA